MPVVPIRSDNAYFGFSKQAVQGTAVAPAFFPRWLDGSKFEYDLKTEEVWEGDGTRRLSQIIKNQQSVTITLNFNPRPVEAGYFECATMGAFSDAVVSTGSAATTTTAPIVGGTTATVGLTSGVGFFGAGAGNYTLLFGAGTFVDPFEAVLCVMPATLGTTQTVAATYNAGKFKLSHPSGTACTLIDNIDTALTSVATAGATTLIVGNNFGLTGAGTASVMVDAGLATEELVAITTPGVGSGPYTFTIAAAGVTKKAHAIGAIVTGNIDHTMVDQTDGSYYTVEVGLGSLSGSAGPTFRVTDCKVDSLKRTAKSGGILEYEMVWRGIATNLQGSPATVTLENHQVFLFTQGTWTLNGVTTGDALAIESFDIQQKNAVDPIQTEQLTLAAIIFGNVDYTFTCGLILQNTQFTALTYMGTAAGTTDAQAIGAGSLNVIFTQADGFHSIQYNVSALHYMKIGEPAPKKDGKHLLLSVEAKGTSGLGLNPYVMQTTIFNGFANIY